MASKTISRRTFIAASATGAAVTIVPRSVLGGAGYVAPSDRVNIGFIGLGTQGLRQLMEALPNEAVNVAAVCDPNKVSDDYIPWGRHELRNKIRRFLDEPTWGETHAGCRCGRDVGKYVVDTYYSKHREGSTGQGCNSYSDFRVLLDKEKEIDGVYVMTPDHLHATVAVAAMKRGLHAITHKPVSNIFHETDLAIQAAKTTGLATALICSADSSSSMQITEWLAADAIGAVKEVHNWSSRPFWPQGMSAYPQEKVDVPEGFDWGLWLGPVPDRPYHPSITHAVFRGWYDFGAGALGDMGHYSFFQIFKILDLGQPLSVEASRSQYWAIIDHLWQRQDANVAYPRASTIKWRFAATEKRPEVSLYWYDGGIRPARFEELDVDGVEMPAEGMLFVGEKGKILAGFSGNRPQLIPKAKMEAFTPPPETLPRPIDQLDQWLRACKGGEASAASFPNVESLCKTICLGNIALRVPQKLEWSEASQQFSNSDEANALLKRKAYREGWEL